MQNVLDKNVLSGDRNSFCRDDVADFGGQNQISGVHSSGTDSFNPFDVRTNIKTNSKLLLLYSILLDLTLLCSALLCFALLVWCHTM